MIAAGGCAAGARPPQEAVATASSSDQPNGGNLAQPPPPRPKPPSPESVTQKEPGGDAEDKQLAALLRQIDEPWGARTDKDDQLLLPLPDFQHWKRVRFWGVEHFVGFRFGSAHHALAIGFVQDAPPGAAVTSEACMRRFEAWGRPQTKPFDVKFGPFSVHHQRWRGQKLEVHSVDGQFAAGFSKTEFSAAWAAYPAYPDACFVFALAVPWREHPALARQVRDRWVKEGFTQLEAKTPDKATRK